MINWLTISLTSIIFVLSIFYYLTLTKLMSLTTYVSRLLIENATLEEMLVSNPKQKSEQEVHNESFLKFLSDSRDWAFEYIEEFQAGLEDFVSSIEPEINYFKEYGDIMSMSPNYYSLKKIVEEYEKLKKLLPQEEQQ